MSIPEVNPNQLNLNDCNPPQKTSSIGFKLLANWAVHANDHQDLGGAGGGATCHDMKGSQSLNMN